MKNSIGFLADAGSFFLAIGIWVFFGAMPGYTPPGEYGTLIGIAIVIVIAILYGIMEALTIIRSDTVGPVYFAWETFLSYLPLIAFAMVVQRMLDGLVVLSSFQWLAALILIAVVLLDILGFVAILAQRYLLTDELKNVN